MSLSSDSEHEEAPKLSRGPTIKTKSANKGKVKVRYNKKGVPVGDGGTKLATFEGMVARQMVKITFDTWRHVPKETKEEIWQYILLNFLLDPRSRSNVLKSVGKKWRNFKHYLFKKYIEDFQQGPGADIYTKPAMYPFLKKDDWRLFVAQRLSKKWQDKSQEGKGIRAHNTYNHRLSRKGYAGLIDEISKETGRDEDEIDRSELWKIARKKKSGEFDPSVKIVVDRIEELQKACSNGEVINSGTNDILTQALGTEEHRGQVRGMGKYITPHQYFYLPRTVKEYVDAEHQKWDSRFNKVEGVLEQIQRGMFNNASDGASCSRWNDADFEDDPIVEYEDKSCFLAVNSASNIVAKGTILEYNHSVDNSQVMMEMCIQEEALLPIPQEDDFVITVKDGLGHVLSWPKHLVVRCSDLEKISRKPKPTDKVKHAIEDHASKKGDDHDPKAQLDDDLNDATERLREKLKEKVQEKVNPSEKVQEKVNPSQKVQGKEKVKDKGPPVTPRRRTRGQLGKRVRIETNRMLKFAARKVDQNELKKSAMRVQCEDALFDSDSFTYVTKEDFQVVFTLDELTGSIITSYMMYLYEQVKNGGEKDHGVCFVSPSAISPDGRTSKFINSDDASRNLSARLAARKDNNLVIIPYNPGRHWVLAILDMETTTCYYLDSGRDQDPAEMYVDPNLKQIVETAMVLYSSQAGLKKRVKVKWSNVPCPRQPGITECGYYCLRFMKEVIGGGVEVLKKQNIGGGKDQYTDADIDEIREDWASYVMNFVI